MSFTSSKRWRSILELRVACGINLILRFFLQRMFDQNLRFFLSFGELTASNIDSNGKQLTKNQIVGYSTTRILYGSI